jgi:hypothetical protein
LREVGFEQIEARDENSRCPDSQFVGAIRKKLGLDHADDLGRTVNEIMLAGRSAA